MPLFAPKQVHSLHLTLHGAGPALRHVLCPPCKSLQAPMQSPSLIVDILAFFPTTSVPQLFQLLGIYEFLPSQELVAMLEGHLCRVQPYLCVSFLAALCGYNADNLDNARLPLYLTFAPAGTSVQNMAHWAQVRPCVGRE